MARLGEKKMTCCHVIVGNVSTMFVCSELCKETMGWLQGEEMSYEFVVINPQAESGMDGIMKL